MAGRGTPATALLVKKAVQHQVHAYEHDPKHASYGTEAVELLGQDARRVFKTLVADLDGRLVVGVVPVARQLDLKALAAALGGKKARMAVVADAERATGYVAGGISPLGQRKALPLALDESAVEHPTIFCSGGRRGLEIELAPADLVTLTRAVVAPISS
ncbi:MULTISPECIES: Cys-tRNA(Pro) deacylase [Actinoalloteichus]|uniref:Cys-tRNA(Pro)/Cys-tRNA(Cys) deacylase n=1 Tax=Actinoalloteichus fjordicus TaxID=1612552 RepID=A0AAC9LJ62_9PSEU|nr:MULTISPECIES: Cys-tRNA(Pro) deacylase [Actinoalloteichus]APU17294.1 Cys-tRNA(Pro) deacylase [Actinoalloteichus fjordicus]APU23377.1 Cys-tRNA(Pro) deacylase [Actinoalloteichus sp. GBA129-24]